MRVEVPALGVMLLLAGCAAPGGQTGGWRVFDSAFDGLENARLVHESANDAFELTWDGRSPYGHKGYYESILREGETIHVSFHSEVGPQATLTLAHLQHYRCDDPTPEPRPTNATVDDDWAAGYVLRAPGECVFHLTLRQDVVAGNGVHLAWEATTIAFDARDKGPGGGAPLRFEASRSVP